MVDDKGKKNGIIIDSLHALDDEEVLEVLIGLGEGRNLEFKRKLPHMTSVVRDMVAFANTEGGVILYGVGDDGSVNGLTKREVQNFYDVIRNAWAIVTPSPRGAAWKLVQYKEKYLGAVAVWPSGYKPFFVKKTAYRRVGVVNLQLNNRDFLTVRNNREQFESLEISEAEIKRFISIADEDAFTEVLLVPFLRRLGFRSVLEKGHRDKTLEFGQDIRSFKLQLPTGHWLYFSAQVKAGNIIYSASEKARSSNIEKVLTQAKMAFTHEMFDAETNTMCLPDHVLLVATGEINEGARLYLSESLSREKRRRILTWEGGYLLERILEQGLPRGCQIEIRKYIARKP